METDLAHADPDGAVGKIAALANKWEARARRAETRGRAVSLGWFLIGSAIGAVVVRVLFS